MKYLYLNLLFFITFLTAGLNAAWAESQNISVQSAESSQASSRSEAWPDASDWDPFQEMENMRQMMNQMFQRSMERANHTFSSFDKSFANPKLDVREEPKEYIVSVDVPGMDKDKLEIETTEQSLTISGERRVEKESKDEQQGYVQMERSYGSFQRTIPMPSNVDTEKISAKYDLGVLTIHLPKKNSEPQKDQAKKIQIT